MRIKRLFKYFPITIVTTSLVLATSPLFYLFDNNSVRNSFNPNQQVDSANHSNQLEHIRSDVLKREGVTDSIKSINIANTVTNGSSSHFQSNSSFSEHSAAIVTKTDGSMLLYMWGDNRYGQLGIGTSGSSTSTPIPALVNTTKFGSSAIAKISLGSSHSVVLLDDGRIFTWGSNTNGELANSIGIGSWVNVTTPTQINASQFDSKIIQIVTGDWNTAFLTENGSMYICGWGVYGVLTITSGSSTLANTSTPTKIESTKFNSLKITQIALGYQHAGAIAEDGSLFMWGRNQLGQLGDGTSGASSTSFLPTPIDPEKFGAKSVKQIALGGSYSAALLDDGSLYMWGSGEYGKLGFNTAVSAVPVPTLVSAGNFDNKKIIQIALSSQHSAALTEDGSLYTWGNNNFGQLGNGSSGGDIFTAIPTKIDHNKFGAKKITQIALGAYNTTIILEDSSLYNWGKNNFGQLGNGLITDASVPTLTQLGKDSHITANNTITAKEAMDKLWVAGKLDLNGFKNSFNLINIPFIEDQKITIATKPIHDDPNGKITMTVRIKYFYDENGLIIANTADTPMIITGFYPGVKTIITAKNIAVSPIVVDKWLENMKIDGKYASTKLSEFLVLTKVPADAQFIIANSVPNYESGVLKFNISTDKVLNGDNDIVNKTSEPFAITLNLTPRITKMAAIASGYPSDFTVGALKNRLFDDNGLVKDLFELKKYMTIIAPADGVQYRLVDNKWNSDTGDGTAKFSVYADKYYDAKGNEKTGTSINTASKVNFSLILQREASLITQKATLPDVRIDKFQTYIKNNGSTVVRSKLAEFFDLTNIPSAAIFTIAKIDLGNYDINNTRSLLKLKLTIDKFNQGLPLSPKTHTQDFELNLTEQHAPTTITYKPVYDQSIRIDTVVNQLTTLSGEPLVNFLKNFLDIRSIPTGATFSVVIENPDELTGRLPFILIPSEIYNSVSEPVAPVAKQFSFTLQLGIKHPPTKITINDIYQKTRIDEFAKNISNLNGKALYDYLVPNYIHTISVFDPTKTTVRINNQNNLTGDIGISFIISAYYDENSIFVNESNTYNFNYKLKPKYQPTVIKSLATGAYPKDITPASFKRQITDKGATVSGNNYTLTPANIVFLKKFLSFESVPANTVHILTWNPDQTDDVTGVLSFNLSLSQHYSAAGDLVTSALPVNNLNLNLLGTDIPPVYPETIITTKVNAPLISSSLDFLDKVYPNGIVSSDKLSTYVDGLQTIPASGNITSIASRTATNTTASFMLEVSAHYNASGTLHGPKSFEFNLKLTPKYAQTKITVLPVGAYPSDLTPTQFRQQLANDGANVNGNIYALNNRNITFLNKFLDLTTVPPSTAYTLTWNNEQTSDTTGQLGFNLIVNQYHNADGNLITNVAQPFNDLALNLASVNTPAIRSATYLKTKVGSPVITSKELFIEMIHDGEGNLVQAKLSEFVDGLASIPTNAMVTVTYVTINQSAAVFEIKLSGYYDGVSENMINEEKTYNFEINVKYVPATLNNQFPWEWILIGAGPSVFIGVVIWLTIKKSKKAMTKSQQANLN